MFHARMRANCARTSPGEFQTRSRISALLPALAPAATTNVTVGQGGTVYSPSAVIIQTGDIVNWTWAGNNHSVTSGTPGNPNGIFDSAIHNSGFTFPVTFNTVGVFAYYCRVHGAMMTGR